jgi:hypothetical protein
LPRVCSRTGDFAGRVPGNQSRASTGDGHRRPRLRAGLGSAAAQHTSALSNAATMGSARPGYGAKP